MLTKEIEFYPAFDKRHNDPNKNYGIHGVEFKFILKGEKGAIQFVVYTNWQLPHVQKEMINDPKNHNAKMIEIFFTPKGYDIGYHSPEPMHEGQQKLTTNCPYLDGKPCYYDGSSLNAEPILEKLISKGHKAVWKEMEEIYLFRFGELV